jgi:hypothetical protein
MAKQVLSHLDFNNVSKVINSINGTADQDLATIAQLNAAIEGVKPKDPVVVSTQGNINLAAPGSSIDGISMTVGDRFLARAQTSNIQNGVYIFNGAAVAATRSLDFNAASEVNNALVPVAQGTDAGVTFRQTAALPVIGTDPVTFIVFGTSVPDASETIKGKIEIATQAETNAGVDDLRAITPAKLASYSGLIKKFSQDIGDGSATQFDITHNLGTDDVHIEVYDNATKETVLVDAKRQSTNVARINFNAAPTSNQFRVVILG